ncbi:hypothetical protein PaeCFBP13512_12755 [Paenibacillus sp. CFBP13512]|uniref:hypothetical protein n=1 Tax=Paenibacillus sp. CFBP13512 TaxID=2184007 RepID=UPI0010C01735|nr:hypothetical protein [Paenibacillus sp. CFBP13512]TKJ90696.1 hypothetical protein PaeCFBP13512_12755 [Paenibacillus sp. CFBP13512]
MLFKKLILPATVIILLCGCVNQQEDVQVTNSSTDSTSTTESTTKTLDTNKQQNKTETTLSKQQKEDIKKYLITYTQGIQYIGQQMQEVATPANISEEMTEDEILANIQPYSDNIDKKLSALSLITTPQIKDTDLQADVIALRDHVLVIGYTGKQIIDNLKRYLKTGDEAIYNDTIKMYEQMAANQQEFMEQAKDLGDQLN